MQLKTIFWGNSDFVLPSLEFLFENTNLCAIFTGKDKPFGRNKKKIKIPEPKIFGQKHNIPVFQDDNLKDPEVAKKISGLAPDLMVVIAYGKLIPESIFEIPGFGTVNVHASLLPKYRGASPIQQSLLKGDTQTGISIQKINARLDEGNILISSSIKIEKNDNFISLKSKLSDLSKTVLKKLINYLKDGKYPEEIVQSGEHSYCKKILKKDGQIQWHLETADEIYNKFRAFIQWPGIFTYYKGKLLKLKDIVIENLKEGKPGEVLKADRDGFIVKAREMAIRIKRLQPADKREMSYLDFLNGHRLKSGDIIGN